LVAEFWRDGKGYAKMEMRKLSAFPTSLEWLSPVR
jgi:hypothetical protein